MGDPMLTVAVPGVDIPAPDTGWAKGVFSTTGHHPPPPCLEHCLGGDPGNAAARGCAMMRRLVELAVGPGDEEMRNDCPGDLQTGCTKGYHAWPAAPHHAGEPSTLILSPLPESGRDLEMLEPAIELLRSSVRETWQHEHENEGLASEILQCYEQINLIFDISAEVAVLSDPREVRRVLLKKLMHIYKADWVVYVDPHMNLALELDREGLISQQDLSRVAPELCENTQKNVTAPRVAPRLLSHGLPEEAVWAIRQMKESPRVIFASESTGDLDDPGYGTSIWGPLQQGDHGQAYVGVIRRDKTFHSGEMLLLDSTLSYGSHILSTMRLVDRLKKVGFESVRALVNAIDQKDPYTYGHSERVGFLARAVGKSMGLSDENLQDLEWGGLLHDIGKIGIPESILNKPGKLDHEEYLLIQKHPARGHAVLQPVQSLRGVLDIVLYHHETPDGKGYPAGLAGDEIPLLASIVHVADTFDALTSTRSYRKAYQVNRALDLLRNEAGEKFDPHVVEHFLRTWENLPQEWPEEFDRWFNSPSEEAE